MDVINWFVELKTSGEIKELIEQEFKKDISRTSVWRFSQRKKWKAVIQRLRARFEKEILKIPIANKVDRLRILQKVANEGMKWSLKTITKEGDEVYELKLGATTAAIREARAEVEGDKALIDNSRHIHIDISGMEDQDRAKFIQEKLNAN